MELEKKATTENQCEDEPGEEDILPIKEDKLGDSYYLTARMSVERLNFTKVFLVFVEKQFFSLVLVSFLYINSSIQ